MEKDVQDLLTGIQYKGYDSKLVREKAALTLKNAQLVLGAYATVGNNPERLTQHVQDANAGKALKALLVGLGIRTDRDADLTMPRIAQAYAPVLLSVRTEMAKLGILRLPQVQTSTPHEYCDLAFNGIYPQAQDYCIKMGRIITRVKEPKLTDQECDARTQSYAALAAAGLERDATLRAAVEDPAKASALTRPQVAKTGAAGSG